MNPTAASSRLRGCALPALLLAVLGATAGCAKPADEAAARTVPRAFRVTTTLVESRPLAYLVQATGSLEAYQVVTIPTRVEGTVETLEFEEGDTVTPDRVLAVVDGERFALLERQAQASVTRSEATLARAGAEVRVSTVAGEEAEKNLSRRRGLRAQNPGWVSEEELGTLESAVERLKAGVEAAKAGLEEARASREEARARLDLARKDLSDSRVRSPIAGVLETRHATVGQFVKVGERLATLVDTSRLRARFRVGEAESVRLLPGQALAFTVRALPGRPFRATLFHVNATADPDTRMVECLATVEEPDPVLKPGFFAVVTIEVEKREKALVVPEGALLPTEKGFVVFALVDGKAQERPVTLGLHTRDGSVEVVGGLKGGETIALLGAQSLSAGVPVEVVDESGKPVGGAR